MPDSTSIDLKQAQQAFERQGFDMAALAASIAEHIASDIKVTHAADDELWSVNEIALYTKLAVNTVHQKIITHPRFPRPVRLQTNHEDSTKGAKRWLAGDVKRFMTKHRV